jgi:predicted dehydrogenase
MAALGIHQIDTFHYLAGAIGGLFVKSKRLLPEGDVDDTTVIVIEFDSGALGHLYTAMASGPVVEVTVNGTGATARNTGDGALLTLQKRGQSERVELPIEQIDTVEDELREFALGVRGELHPETDGVEARKAVAVLEAIVQSADSNQWVAVSYS